MGVRPLDHTADGGVEHTAPSLEELYATAAVADVRTTPFDGVLPGVDMHATVIDNVLRNDFITQPKWTVLAEIWQIVFSALLLGIVLRHARGVQVVDDQTHGGGAVRGGAMGVKNLPVEFREW